MNNFVCRAVIRAHRAEGICWRMPKTPSMEALFSEYYRVNFWGSQESRSGQGSTMVATEKTRAELTKLIRELEVESLLDAPCGDFNWMQHVEVKRYVGVEIVKDLVDELAQKHGNEQRSFLHADISSTPLPKVDLIFCRDAIIHLPLATVGRALKNFKNSGSKYLLITTCPWMAENGDIRVPGGWFMPNLEKKPFKLPRPRKIIEEYAGPGVFARNLGLWKLKDVPDAVDLI